MGGALWLAARFVPALAANGHGLAQAVLLGHADWRRIALYGLLWICSRGQLAPGHSSAGQTRLADLRDYAPVANDGAYAQTDKLELTMTMVERVFSGVQPTGNLHLGNYLGGDRQHVNCRNPQLSLLRRRYARADAPVEVLGRPADTRAQYPRSHGGLHRQRHRSEEAHRLHQSQVSDTRNWHGSSIVWRGFGWLNRMTQFKEKAGKDRETPPWSLRLSGA